MKACIEFYIKYLLGLIYIYIIIGEAERKSN